MDTYERASRVRAPLETVVGFHSTADGLEALTPSALDLRVERVTGPDGEEDPDVLAVGSTVVSSISPLGVLPRQRWVSEITERFVREESGGFTDVMTAGPFPHWRHSHRFFADGEDTIVYDRVEYRLPGGALGRALGPFGVVGFEPMFAYRHRRTRELLDGRTSPVEGP